MPPVYPSFSAGNVDRNAAARREPALWQALVPGACWLWLWQGQVPLTAGGLLCMLPGPPLMAGVAPLSVYLGRTDRLGDIFTAASAQSDTPPPLPAGAAWCDLRQVMADLDADEAELAATAKALLSWHQSHRFCSACGQPSTPAEAGWQRLCPACNAAHFPRTDPVVIMLITCRDLVLLGRSAAWPEGMYSTLAGFMEPGETIEAAVRREVHEEAGITVSEVRFVTSQPWPFPASLMLGCHGRAINTEITLDRQELEDALWISRAELAGVMAGLHPKVRAPRRGSIAHSLLVNLLADHKG